MQVPGVQWSTVNSCSPYGKHVLKTDGTLWAWGLNNYGQLGLNNRTQYSSPVQVPGTEWSKVASGSYGGTALKTDNTLWVWGDNANGTLGQNDITLYSSPVQIPGTNWINVFESYNNTNGAFQQQ